MTLAALAALTIVWAWLRDETRARRTARWLNVPVCWTIARFLPWLAVYVVAGFATQSDVSTVFWPQAHGVVEGGLPYRDFECFYSPLFPYLIALPVLLWNDPRVLVLFLSLLEAVTVALTLRAAGVAPRTSARSRWLAFYFFAPGPLLLAVIGGQEDFLMWTGAVLLWLTLTRFRDFGTGLLTVVCTLFSKPLFLIPAAAFFGLSRRRWQFLAGAGPAALVVLAGLWVLTGRAFLHVLDASENIDPPNLWIWLHWLSGGRIPIGNPALSMIMVATVTGFGAWYFSRHAAAVAASHRHFFAAWTVLFALSMLINLKSLGAYFAYFALPALALFLELNDRRALLWWLVLGALAPIESSLWYRTGRPLLSGLPSTPLVALDYALQGVMLVALVALALSAHRFLRQTPPAEAALPA